MRYVVRYVAGPYSGTLHVSAEDEEQAIAIAKRRVRSTMTLPMYSETYKIESSKEEDS